jgi:toxin YoeB
VEIFRKINILIFDIDRDPYKGLGKPEPLKSNLQGWWSRRITEEHRIVYRIEKNILYVISVHGHYKDFR